jgi:hypothetical protein
VSECAWCDRAIPPGEDPTRHADRCHTQLFPDDEIEVTLVPDKKPQKVPRYVWFPEHTDDAITREKLERRRELFLRDLRRRQGVA